MPPSHPPLPTPRSTFDPYNSSATGHQRADNRLAGSTSWRASRTLKLSHQFRAGAGGGARVSDTVGAGSAKFGHDGWKENGGWERGASGLRNGESDIRDLFGRRMVKRRKVDGCDEADGREGEKADGSRALDTETVKAAVSTKTSECDPSRASVVGSSRAKPTPTPASALPLPLPPIFRNLTVYINGSTAPLVSDHRLKHLLVAHGANLSIALGRRTVTHVILGAQNQAGRGGGGGGGGCGGGLAGGKLQREIGRVGGCGVRYVGVEW